MLLAIDIGNTNIVLGVFSEGKLVEHWRIWTEPEKTPDEYGVLIRNLYHYSNIPFEETDATIISCVVPPLLETIKGFCQKYLNIIPLIVEPGIKTGMPILYNNPKEVGADRIVNAVAAYERYRDSLIIVDFGTATTFDYISAQGEYMGGAIAPGVSISSDALFHKAAKLPRVEFLMPPSAIGKDTVTSIQSGLFHGSVGMVDGIVESIKREVKENPKVIATGGLAPLIAKGSKTIDEIDPLLTLEGLKIIYEKNI